VRKTDAEGRYFCHGCTKWLPRASFHTSKKNKTAGIQSRCAVCLQAQRIKWHSKPRAALLSLENHARRRGRGYSLPEGWAITQWELQGGHCFHTDMAMTMGHGNGRVWTNVSVDRLDSDGPYSPDNCVLCCLGFNLMKTTLALDAMEEMALAFLKKRGRI
jgi:hypothetical protein